MPWLPLSTDALIMRLGAVRGGYATVMKPQPRGARGTVGHANSALNLRLVLALFGLVSCGVLAVLTARAGFPVPAAMLALFAAVALVDLVVIMKRRAARRRAEPPGTRHSLFE